MHRPRRAHAWNRPRPARAGGQAKGAGRTTLLRRGRGGPGEAREDYTIGGARGPRAPEGRRRATASPGDIGATDTAARVATRKPECAAAGRALVSVRRSWQYRSSWTAAHSVSGDSTWGPRSNDRASRKASTAGSATTTESCASTSASPRQSCLNSPVPFRASPPTTRSRLLTYGSCQCGDVSMIECAS